MDELAERHLGHTASPSSRCSAGTGKSAQTFAQVPLDKATRYAAEDADVTLRLWMALKPRLRAERMTTVYETLERPLVPVLAEMEAPASWSTAPCCRGLSRDFAQRMAALEEEIHKLAGAQVQPRLAEAARRDCCSTSMSCRAASKTKTGA